MSSPEQVQVRIPTVLDDESRQVGRIYAEALYKAAEKTGQQEEALGELDALVHGVFKEDPGLELFFSSPAVGKHRKEAALQKAFSGRATEVFTRFLLVLNHHERLGLLRAIATAYKTLHEQRTHKFHAVVRSAIPLTDEERGRLYHDLREISGREPILEEAIDPSLLGGLVVRVGDWVYDTSMRTRLEMLRNQLIERSSHDIQGGRDRFGN